MGSNPDDEVVSLRIRLSRSIVDRIDQLVGESGRQRYIRDSISYRLDEDLPPVVYELMNEVEQLKARVGHLENAQATSVYNRQMNDIVRTKVCRDEFDRKMLTYFLQHRGATAPELAKELLSDPGKRRTIVDRISKMNGRAEEFLGVVILQFQKGEMDGKRGAWWVVNVEQIVE
jgi:hypothetical protein